MWRCSARAPRSSTSTAGRCATRASWRSSAARTSGVWDSSPGIPNLETVVPLILTEVNKGNVDLKIIPKIFSENAAKIYGLENKGKIAIGMDADFTVIDLKREGKFNIDEFKTKAEYSPFDGWEYEGLPIMTIVNGKIVMNKI